jgi:hypothetical protein
LAVFEIDDKTGKKSLKLKHHNTFFGSQTLVSPTMKFTAATFVAVIGTAAAFSGSSS